MSVKGFKGYIFSRPAGGNFTPQRVQNLVIREYAKKLNKIFLLSATEYYMEDCFLMLDALTDETDDMEAVVFYSSHMLPLNKEYRVKVLKKFLQKNVEVHFALEEIAIKKESEIEQMEEVIMVRAISAEFQDVKI